MVACTIPFIHINGVNGSIGFFNSFPDSRQGNRIPTLPLRRCSTSQVRDADNLARHDNSFTVTHSPALEHQASFGRNGGIDVDVSISTVGVFISDSIHIISDIECFSLLFSRDKDTPVILFTVLIYPDIESPLITLFFGLGIIFILIRSLTQALQVIVLSWLPIQINRKAAFIQRISFQRLNIQTFGSAAMRQIDCNKVVGSGRRKSSRADTFIYPLPAPSQLPFTDFVSYRRYANQLLHKNLCTGFIFIVGDNINITIQLTRQCHRIAITLDAVLFRIFTTSHFHNNPIGQFRSGFRFGRAHLARQLDSNLAQFLHADGQLIQDFVSITMFVAALQSKAERRTGLIGFCVVNLTITGIRAMAAIKHGVRAIKGNVISFNLLQVDLNFNVALHVGKGIDIARHRHIRAVALNRLQSIPLVHIHQELQCTSLLNRCRTTNTGTFLMVNHISYVIGFYRSLIVQADFFTVTQLGTGNVVALSTVIHSTVICSNIRDRHLVHSGVHKSVTRLFRYSCLRNRPDINLSCSGFLSVQYDGDVNLALRFSKQHGTHQHGCNDSSLGGHNHKGAERGHFKGGRARGIVIVANLQRTVLLHMGSISSFAFSKVQSADGYSGATRQFRTGQSNIPHLDVNDFRTFTQSSLNGIPVIIRHLGVAHGERGILRQNSRNGSFHTVNISSDFVFIRLDHFGYRSGGGRRRSTGRRCSFCGRCRSGFRSRCNINLFSKLLNDLLSGSRSGLLSGSRSGLLSGSRSGLLSGSHNGLLSGSHNGLLSRGRNGLLNGSLRRLLSRSLRRLLSRSLRRLLGGNLSRLTGRRRCRREFIVGKYLDRRQGSQHRKDQQNADHAACLEP